MSGPARIWLEPECCANPQDGRLWAETNVWPNDDSCDATGIEYVRADAVAKLVKAAKVTERAASLFNQLRTTIAVRYDGTTEYALWTKINEAFDVLAEARTATRAALANLAGEGG